MRYQFIVIADTFRSKLVIIYHVTKFFLFFVWSVNVISLMLLPRNQRKLQLFPLNFVFSNLDNNVLKLTCYHISRPYVIHCASATLLWGPCTHSSKERVAGFRKEEDKVINPDFRGTTEERNLYYPTQNDFNDLIRDFCLTQSSAELLTSRHKQWNVLDESVKISSQRKCHQHFSNFFTCQDELCFYHNVTSLFEAIGVACNSNKWYFFINSSYSSLKAVLLHNRNMYPFLLAHFVQLKEEYNSIKILLDTLKYEKYGLEVIGNLKMMTFLMFLKGSFTKFPCYPCLWDSRNTVAGYHKRDCPQWTGFSVRKNIKWEPLLDPWKVLFLPLHWALWNSSSEF